MSYPRSGVPTQTGSAGHSETIGRDRVTEMNAGRGLGHETHLPAGEDVRIGQAREARLPSLMRFADLREEDRIDRRRPLAGRDADAEIAPTPVRRDGIVMDVCVVAGDVLASASPIGP